MERKGVRQKNKAIYYDFLQYIFTLKFNIYNFLHYLIY